MRTIIFLIMSPSLFLLCFPFLVMFKLFGGKHSVLCIQNIGKLWAKLLLWVVGVKVSIEGKEHITEDPHIFAVNHQSMFDILILLAYMPLPFHFIAKESLFKWPIFGWGMHWAGYYPINRSSPADARRTMDAIVQNIVTKKASILIFPEGTRSSDHQLLPFKKGCASMAHQSGTVIYPVGIQNSWKIVKKGSIVLAPCMVTLRIGVGLHLPKRSPDELTALELNTSTQLIREAVSKLL